LVGGPDYTGLLTGPTSQNVIKQLAWDQGIDRLFARETGLPYTPDTPFGPIAVLKSATPHLKAPTLARLKELWDRLIRSSEIPGEISNAILGKSEKNPFAGVGEATKEYFNNLHDAVERVKDFQKQIETGILSDNSFNQTLDELTTDVGKVEDEAKALSQDRSNHWTHWAESFPVPEDPKGGDEQVTYDVNMNDGSITIKETYTLDGVTETDNISAPVNKITCINLDTGNPSIDLNSSSDSVHFHDYDPSKDSGDQNWDKMSDSFFIKCDSEAHAKQAFAALQRLMPNATVEMDGQKVDSTTPAEDTTSTDAGGDKRATNPVESEATQPKVSQPAPEPTASPVETINITPPDRPKDIPPDVNQDLKGY
jgi:hypothetical protein